MTLATQFYTLVAMIGMGSFFGAALDTYNRFLKRSERKRWIVFFHDVLFWVIQGLLIFYVLFLINQGEIRFYLFLALLCGFSAYQALFKNLYRSSLELLIKIFVKFSELCFKLFQLFIFFPIKWVIVSCLALLAGIVKALFFLFQHVLKLFFMILCVVFRPFQWIFKKLWKKMPKNVTKKVGKFYNKLTGIFLRCKNVIKTLIKWKKGKD